MSNSLVEKTAENKKQAEEIAKLKEQLIQIQNESQQ